MANRKRSEMEAEEQEEKEPVDTRTALEVNVLEGKAGPGTFVVEAVHDGQEWRIVADTEEEALRKLTKVVQLHFNNRNIAAQAEKPPVERTILVETYGLY